jgi:sulfocyanin
VLAVITVAAALPAWTPAGAAGHTVEMNMVVQPGVNAGYNYSGFAKGAMTVTVPTGWQVIIHFTNNGDLAHSLIVLPFTPAPPAVPPTTPAFPGAATRDVQGGLAVKSTETITFTAGKAGAFQFVCGVPAHAVLGMWNKLTVSSSATQPTVTPAAAAGALGMKIH